MNSRRAALPRSSHAHGTGAGPRFQIEKSISRATTVSCWRLRTRPRSRGSTPARESSRNSFGISPAARTSVSSSGAPRSMWRSAIGLRVSRPSRSVADSRPQIRSPSSTARCSDPAASISTVASIASWVGGTVATGVRTAARAGASSGTPSTATAARIEASVRIPNPPPSSRTSSAETPSRPSRAAAARSGSSGSQNSGRLITSDTGVVPTSGSPCTVCPAYVSRFRIEIAT